MSMNREMNAAFVFGDIFAETSAGSESLSLKNKYKALATK